MVGLIRNLAVSAILGRRKGLGSEALLVQHACRGGLRGLPSVWVIKGLSSVTPGMACERRQQSREWSLGLTSKSTRVQSPDSKLCENASPQWRGQPPRY